MSKSASMSAYQIRLEGWKALTERLGPAGAMRFMMQYDPGHGDYTKERQEIFADLELEDLIASIRQQEPDRPATDSEPDVTATSLNGTEPDRADNLKGTIS